MIYSGALRGKPKRFWESKLFDLWRRRGRPPLPLDCGGCAAASQQRATRLKNLPRRERYLPNRVGSEFQALELSGPRGGREEFR